MPPSPSEPLGNPRYPGRTSSNGPNWVGFLTTKYNASLIQTYNLASSGATVDSALVRPFWPTVVPLKDQVRKQFVPVYTPPGQNSASPLWTSDNSLFAIWIGINDVGMTYNEGENISAPLYSKIVGEYRGSVDQLYMSGARNFVFLTVPPVDRSPVTAGQGRLAQDMERSSILTFNRLVGDMVGEAKGHYKDINAWIYDTYRVFNEVLDDPKAYAQTSLYKNTTAYCGAYAK